MNNENKSNLDVEESLNFNLAKKTLMDVFSGGKYQPRPTTADFVNAALKPIREKIQSETQREAQQPMDQAQAQQPTDQAQAQQPMDQAQAQQPMAQAQAQQPMAQAQAQQPMAQPPAPTAASLVDTGPAVVPDELK